MSLPNPNNSVKGFINRVIDYFPLSPVFLAASAVLSLFLHNIGELTIDRLFLPLAACLLFALLVSYLSRFIMHEIRKGDIFSSVFIILFFTYGAAWSAIGEFSIVFGKIVLGKNHLLLSIWILIMIAALIFLERTHRKLLTLNKSFLLIGLVMIVFTSFGIVNYQLTQRMHPVETSRLALPSVRETSTGLPDVYYIVPDSYAAPINLSTYFSYDDSAFVSYLKNKGFYLAGGSTSNYPTTVLSLSSTLNMEYIDYLSSHHNSSDISVAAPLIQNSNVLQLFRTLGYKYYQMGSWWWPTGYNPLASDNYNIQKENHLGISVFPYAILESTALQPFLDSMIPEKVIGESDEDKREIVVYQFDNLPKVASLPGPKFVFVHIISPHGPYVFDKNCGVTSYTQNWYRPEEQNYTAQINCINKKLETAIDSILKTSSKPPVILLQADEGAKFIAGMLKPEESWQNATTTQLKMKFPILSAYYLPGEPKDKLYQTITPVNSFRIIFNLYFDAKMPLLPDKNYIYLDNKHLYDFRDVTKEIHG